jgi:hypothetical protein
LRVHATTDFVVDCCILGVGGLSRGSHGSGCSGGELVGSDGETAVLRLRCGNGAGEGLTVGPEAIGSVEARLAGVSESQPGHQITVISVRLQRLTWMRFFPSAFCTRGCNLVVVKVYTRPVSETTSSNTCVPVRIDSSYA